MRTATSNRTQIPQELTQVADTLGGKDGARGSVEAFRSGFSHLTVGRLVTVSYRMGQADQGLS